MTMQHQVVPVQQPQPVMMEQPIMVEQQPPIMAGQPIMVEQPPPMMMVEQQPPMMQPQVVPAETVVVETAPGPSPAEPTVSKPTTPSVEKAESPSIGGVEDVFEVSQGGFVDGIGDDIEDDEFSDGDAFGFDDISGPGMETIEMASAPIEESSVQQEPAPNFGGQPKL